MLFGVSIFATEYTMHPANLARALEERGFESLWLPVSIQRESVTLDAK
jgi:alkanesulfonate monooxygenase SsuD/methylene tetrahydromethanopterin reductase-like flavin-dependent oxidoreductase (luciferase family)